MPETPTAPVLTLEELDRQIAVAERQAELAAATWQGSLNALRFLRLMLVPQAGEPEPVPAEAKE